MRSEVNERLRRRNAGDGPDIPAAGIDTTPDIILVKDREGRYVLGNEAAGRIFRSTVQGIGWQDRLRLLSHQDPATDALVIAEQSSHDEGRPTCHVGHHPITVTELPATEQTGSTHWLLAATCP